MKRNGCVQITLLLLSLVVLQFSMTACDDAKSRAKKILSLKNERQELLDKLYTEYGGSDLANAVSEKVRNDQCVQQPEGKAVSNGIGAWATNVDRRFFEGTLRSIGQGQDSAYFSESAKAFFSRPDIRKQARKFCEIEIELELLGQEKYKKY